MSNLVNISPVRRDLKLPSIAGVEINIDEQGRFNLNALHKASGAEKKNGPSYWLALDSTKSLIDALRDRNADTDISVSPTNIIKGGTLQGSFAHELLAVSYAGWISPSFQLKVNQTFLDYKNGLLKPVQQELTRIEILQMAIDAETERAEAQEKVNFLEHKMEELEPKADFHDQVSIAEDSISIGEAAKVIGTGRTRLFDFLRKKGWLNRYNEPYQNRIEAGHLQVKIGTFKHPTQGLKKSITPLFTGKGLTLIHKIWKESHAA